MKQEVLSQLDFFERLSDSYDQMISWPARIGTEGMFFKKLVNDYKLKSSLDVACSTGFHVIMLRRLGLDAVGIDASPKMIEKARANSVTCGVTVEYILGDFTTMSKRFSEGFDLITCLGDTVSHLKPSQDLKKTFEEAYKCLNPGGLFVLQSRNYDYILKHQARFAPPTGSRNGTEETIFFRLLDFLPKSLNFSIVKFRWHENRWESSVQTTQIYPYLKKDLESTLRSVGLTKFTSYRNFNFEDYDPNGMDLIMVAEKKGVLKSKLASSLRRDKPVAKSGTVSAKPVDLPPKAVKASKAAARKGPPPQAAKRKGKK
jgi:glycine/sarcosine N-methyltransferase